MDKEKQLKKWNNDGELFKPKIIAWHNEIEI